jgi:hypothetical protein
MARRKEKKKYAGHCWRWWVRQLRKDWLGFQASKRIVSFCLATKKNDYNFLLIDAAYRRWGKKAADELYDTLSW